MSKDPKIGTGKKPRGSGRRLYTDENPKDTVRIKYATTKDAKATAKKVKNIKKPYDRKIQILTVMEQRSKYGGKPQQAKIAKKTYELFVFLFYQLCFFCGMTYQFHQNSCGRCKLKS